MKGVTLPTETVFVLEMSPIKFGLGATDEIGYDALRLGVRKALIFTDRHVAEVGLPERVRQLNTAINTAVAELTKSGAWARLGIEPVSETVEQFTRYIANDVNQSAELLKAAGFKPE